jgi:cysteine-rich repeat protein
MKTQPIRSYGLLAVMSALPLALGACGSSASDVGTDGGGTPDAIQHGDSGHPTTRPDTGTGHDAAGTPDTGTRTDSGVHAMDGGALCGNGTLDGTEECDDGNHLDLDGCDSSCHYEVVSRMTAITISGSAGPAFCISKGNALGTKAITSTALNELNPPLQTDVANGTVNVFMQAIGLTDLTGVADPHFTIGVMDGKLDPAKGTWPTAGNPIDWWFLVDPTTVSEGLPTGVLGSASIVGGTLNAGPSTVNLALNLGGTPATLTMRDATVAATINATPAPDVPAPPPAKLAAGLTVFQTVTATGADQGLCGDITVASLAQIPVPSVLTSGTAACKEGYTSCGSNPVGPTCNSLLDVIVGGCSVLGGVIVAVNPTQPDVPVGAMVQTLTVGANKKVTLPSTPDDDAYSAYLQFAANRAHFTGEYCTVATDCQTGQACTSSVCK